MTLVEIMVVLGVIGLLLAISVPALTRYSQQVRLKSAIQQIVGLVSLARSMAISAHAEHALVIDAERGELRVVNVESGEALDKVAHLPSFVTLAVEVGGEPAVESRVVFRPTGSLTGRTMSLVVGDRHTQRTITVTGPTGAVSVR